MNGELSYLLPPILTANKLYDKLLRLPYYSDDIRARDTGERLLCLPTLYDIFIPNRMTEEIYTSTYLAVTRALTKKEGSLAVKQGYSNYSVISGSPGQGLLQGYSYSVTGPSGIGKSTAIAAAVKAISPNVTINYTGSGDNIFACTRVIPVMSVQTPFDCSAKSLMLEILRKIDLCLDTDYYRTALKTRTTVDMLVGTISQVSFCHIGIIILDEAQHLLCGAGAALMKLLVQLINSSGVSLCFVGTPECRSFFSQEYYLARRSLGLEYDLLPFDEEFRLLCETLFRYQYTAFRTELSEGILHWLYDHSNGNTSTLVDLLYYAQELAILTGHEQLDLSMLQAASRQRLSMLRDYIEHERIVYPPAKRRDCSNNNPPEQKSDFPVSSETPVSIASVLKSGNRIDAIIRDLSRIPGVTVTEVSL